MAFADWDIGACNCTASLHCSPCNLPAANLNLAWSNTFGDSGSVALTTVGLIGSTITWTAACQNTPAWKVGGGAASFTFSIVCATGVGATSYTISLFSAAGCVSAAGGSAVFVSTYTCSPLNMVINYGVTFTFTITL
jgi:hypothetical protein